MSERPIELRPAVSYLRMSSDDQKMSLEQQRGEIRRMAAERHYTITHEYCDAGKSGSRNQEARTEFLAMIADSASGKFSAILCYDTSRFGRVDVLDGADTRNTLRKVNVVLETVKEGCIDWNTFEGRVVDMLLSETNHKFSRNISNVSLRGRTHVVESGYWPNGSIPYGYDRTFNINGEPQVSARLAPSSKPRNAHLKLAPNATESSIVSKLFRDYATKDVSLRGLANALNAENISSPSGKSNGWTKDSIISVLTNRAYRGVAHFGHHRRSSKEAFNRAAPTEKEDCWEALVDEATYQSVQGKLAANKRKGHRQYSARASVASGFLRCGNCGYALEKKSRQGSVYFICPSAVRRQHLGCRQWRIHENVAVPVLTHLLAGKVEFELLKSIASSPKEVQTSTVENLETKRKLLQEKIKVGAKRLMQVPDAAKDACLAALNELSDELKAVEAKIQTTTACTEGNHAMVEAWGNQKAQLVNVGCEVYERQRFNTYPIEATDEFRNALWNQLGNAPGECRVAIGADGKLVFNSPEGLLYDMNSLDEVWFWEETSVLVKAPITAEVSALRELLKKLSAQLTIYWEPRGNRYFSIKGIKFEAKVGEHSLGDCSSRCSRARSRDRD